MKRLITDKQPISLTSISYAKPILNLTWEDLKDANGNIDWELIHEYFRNVLNIMAVTEYGSGKTFGICVYYLFKRKSTLCFLLNTQAQVDIQITALLEALQYKNYDEEQLSRLRPDELAIKEYFEDWTIEGSFWFDAAGNKRMMWASVPGFSNIKGARAFFPRAVVYDEFNQSVKYAELKGSRVKAKVDIILNRFVSKTNAPEHIFYFANKNVPGTPLMGTTLMNDLGITSLSILGEVAKIYYEFPNKNLQEAFEKGKFSEELMAFTVVLNPQYTEAGKVNKVMQFLAEHDKGGENGIYSWNLEQLVTGDGEATLFNSDLVDYEELIFNTRRATSDAKGFQSWALEPYIKLASEDGNYMTISRWKGEGPMWDKKLHFHIQYHKEIPSDQEKILYWKKLYREKQKEISSIAKSILFSAVEENVISYEDTVSRVKFLREIL